MKFKPILVQDATLSDDGKTIKNNIHILDERLRKYFSHAHMPPLPQYVEYDILKFPVRFYATYERDISHVPLGILNIPALSSIIHIAWAVGADVEINELDETYYCGLECAKDIYGDNPAYNWLSLDSNLIVAKPTKNTFKKQGRQALLFSGGLDSTASWLHRKPEQLIMVWGLDVPTSWRDFWVRIKSEYQDLPITVIQSNINEICNPHKIAVLGASCPAGYYAGYSFNIVTFGTCPPITVGNVDSVMMSSTFPTRQYDNPDYPFQNYKPHHIIGECLSWANIKTVDVETDSNRPEKIERFVKPYFDKYGPTTIRVCGNLKNLTARKDQSALNCSHCDKCGKIIATLCNYGIDPNTCGFTVDATTFARIKSHIVNRIYNIGREQYFWGELKKHINLHAKDIYGSQAFLRWLRGYQL